MSAANSAPSPPPRDVLERYRVLAGTDIFAIGLFDDSVTVLSQQVRALNLAWALAEARRMETRPKIAILGAGFAGLTFAAGLIGKEIDAEITILEQLDSVIPLQQGSDSRWLHPHIYDWPSPGSQASSATSPLLNWTAGRASDVAVQVQSAWSELVDSHEPTLSLFCNTSRTRLSREGGQLYIEWIGHEREPSQPSTAKGSDAHVGRREAFDLVVLAVGFGVEKGGGMSYWRNETLAQPSLNRSVTRHVVSGHGDGGWIDLFRLRIMNFRQDRILGELFANLDDFIERLRVTKLDLKPSESAIAALEEIWDDYDADAKLVEDRMRRRLRHDTSAAMNLRGERGFSELFARRVSFQNQVLAWILFRVGAFEIQVEPNLQTAADGYANSNVVLRHGPNRFSHLLTTLSNSLQEELLVGHTEDVAEELLRLRCRQTDAVMWDAGYFDRPMNRSKSDQRSHWNREYLPPVTQIIAASICGAVAKYIEARGHRQSKRLRVTLHRAIPVGRVIYLQQCCDYQGLALEEGFSTAARTYATSDSAIGQAYQTRAIVRNAKKVKPRDLKAEMTNQLSLTTRSRPMDDEVKSLLSIPIIDESSQAVIGVVFLDSFQRRVFKDDVVHELVSIIEGQLRAAIRELDRTKHALTNVEWAEAPVSSTSPAPLKVRSLEVVAVPPPSVAAGRINIDLASFVKVGM
ncbi:hypothetical protein [Microbacterium sp. NPDC087589]|uniref:hypothetical protein n=1 Tax=Microbacterium sp. NPDC087589 TaxID=3364191 RepID=UPI00380DFAEB